MVAAFLGILNEIFEGTFTIEAYGGASKTSYDIFKSHQSSYLHSLKSLSIHYVVRIPPSYHKS